MAAFRKAVEREFPTEIDVHLIADGTLVIFHDDYLKRMTGAEGAIYGRTLPELRRLRLAGTDETIPTFDEVLDLFEDAGLPLLIELKVDKGNYRELSEAVIRRLDSYKGEYAIQSFDPRVLMVFRRLRPEVARGQLAKNYFVNRKGISIAAADALSNMRFNAWAKPDFISYKYKDRNNKALRREVDRKGKTEAAWVIRTEAAYRKAISEGCIPIFEGFDPDNVKGVQR